MPYDGFFIKHQLDELTPLLKGAKLDKIHMPEKDELLLHFRNYDGNKKLLLSCNPSYPRFGLVENNKPNPLSPPMFCMLLRKHLGGGRLRNVVQKDNERIIIFQFQATTELGMSKNESLVLEVMGKHSNLILVDDETGQIIDSLKRIPESMSSVRQILPNLPYALPPNQHKISPFHLTLETLEGLFAEEALSLFQLLLQNIEGFAQATVKEILSRSALDGNVLAKEVKHVEIQRLFLSIQDFLKTDKNPVRYFSEQNQPVDFAPFEYHIYKKYRKEFFESPDRLVYEYYVSKDRADRLKSYASDLTKLLSTHLKRNKNKLKKLEQERKQSEERQIYKIYGDLLLSHLHLQAEKTDHLTCQNFYAEKEESIQIPLDPRLNLIENANLYFKKYNKLKNAYALIENQIQETKGEISYLEHVLNHIENATELQIIDEIRGELFNAGYLKKKKNQRTRKQAQMPPLSYAITPDFKVLIGRNNLQNEQVTHKLAHKNDIWFHVKDAAGSHIILVNPNGLALDEIPDGVIEQAAGIAAFFSKNKYGSKVAVDYTYRKNVKKHPTNKPGLVQYENYYTVYIEPQSPQI